MDIIKDNRIVSDTTFATRFVSLLKEVEAQDQMGMEELEYMRSVAKKLLEHQINTVSDKDEQEYLKRCHPNAI